MKIDAESTTIQHLYRHSHSRQRPAWSFHSINLDSCSSLVTAEEKAGLLQWPRGLHNVSFAFFGLVWTCAPLTRFCSSTEASLLHLQSLSECGSPEQHRHHLSTYSKYTFFRVGRGSPALHRCTISEALEGHGNWMLTKPPGDSDVPLILRTIQSSSLLQLIRSWSQVICFQSLLFLFL